MTTRSSRYRARVLLLALILAALSATVPTGSVPALDLDSLDSGDLRVIEDVSRWVERNDLSEAPSVRDEIRRRNTGFEVFRSFHDREDRHAYVSSLPFGDMIRRASSRYGVDSLLLAAVIEIESSFDPQAVSRRGAVGLMQVLPTTAGLAAEVLTEPAANIDRGAEYLQLLLKRFDGDLELALAAYNAGPTNVRRYGGVPPFAETQTYVEKVLRLYVRHHRAVWQASEEADLLLGGVEGARQAV
ncbi:MAG: lytic transglycosylase domain-containing protein [Thermoanaerobaculia bacterium]|nr:lytic transglycosylase domain-containing protein [Thermoanaerobaculia bacterium]